MVIQGIVMYKNIFKRILDFTIVLVALLCAGWFIFIITIWLHFANKGAGAFFSQIRIGKNERPFKIYKFKSMTDERDADGKLLPDAQRLTKVGRFIRSTSLDELPQLFNVLRGDMALIGPRPLPPSYLAYYTAEEAVRHQVRPGITSWAQVNGRKNITWEHKLECDVYYVRHLTMLLDVKIFFLTIINVLKRDGVGVDTSGQVSLYDTRPVQRPEYLNVGKQNEARSRQ